MSELLQIPGEITKVTSLSRGSIRIQVDSQEELDPQVMASTMMFLEKYGWFCFLQDSQIQPVHVLNLPDLPSDNRKKKSKSQLLRWRLEEWGKTLGHKPGSPEMEAFYEKQMDIIIDAVNSKFM